MFAVYVDGSYKVFTTATKPKTKSAQYSPNSDTAFYRPRNADLSSQWNSGCCSCGPTENDDRYELIASAARPLDSVGQLRAIFGPGDPLIIGGRCVSPKFSSAAKWQNK